MAFHGDFSSYSLPDLLQWLDGSRKSGALETSWDGGSRKLFLDNGKVIATSSGGLWERLARHLALARMASGDQVIAGLQQMQAHVPPELAFAGRDVSAD